MKKMVCEICESRKIKKIGDVFVCEECGTEYDLESAKKLLKEVDIESKKTDNQIIKNEEASKIIKNDDDKYILLKYLKNWYELINGLSNINFWIRIEDKNLLQKGDLNTIKNYVQAEQKRDIPLIDKNWFIRCLDVKFTFEDVDKLKNISQLYPVGKDPIDLFRNNYYIKKCEDLFQKAKYEKIYVNGQGPFYCYFFGDVQKKFKVGYPWAIMNESYENWLNFAKTQEEYISVYDTVQKGMFFDKVQHTIIEKQISAEEFKKNIVTLYKQIKDRHKELVDFYNSNFEVMKKTYMELLSKIEELEEYFNLPLKYRRIDYIYNLITYINDGRVDSWKEAINLLETEIFQNNLITSMKNIEKTIANIDKTVSFSSIMLNSKLTNISQNISNISGVINSCNESLNKIQKDTRFNLICDL